MYRYRGNFIAFMVIWIFVHIAPHYWEFSDLIFDIPGSDIDIDFFIPAFNKKKMFCAQDSAFDHGFVFKQMEMNSTTGV
jgi:hypothetical protein